jgi:hypothetical protein
MLMVHGPGEIIQLIRSCERIRIPRGAELLLVMEVFCASPDEK